MKFFGEIFYKIVLLTFSLMNLIQLNFKLIYWSIVHITHSLFDVDDLILKYFKTSPLSIYYLYIYTRSRLFLFKIRKYNEKTVNY